MSTPIPTGATLEALLRSMVADEVDKRLRAHGAVQAPPDPRALRQGKGMSVADLAARSALSPAIISRIESGQSKRPLPQTLNALARALGISEQEYRQAFAALRQRGGVA